uniref:Uncharacterized protein n=1 Tax=Arundo donax TaxID=35708 RepID=A0A0A9EX60_ARUDO
MLIVSCREIFASMSSSASLPPPLIGSPACLPSTAPPPYQYHTPSPHPGTAPRRGATAP